MSAGLEVEMVFRAFALLAKCSYVYFFLGTRALNVAVFRLETEPWLGLWLFVGGGGGVPVESGNEAEVGNVTLSVDMAPSPFVSTVLSFSEFTSALFPALSTDLIGFPCSGDSSFVGALWFVIGSSLEFVAGGCICLRGDGVLGACWVVLMSVSLLTLLRSFS